MTVVWYFTVTAYNLQKLKNKHALTGKVSPFSFFLLPLKYMWEFLLSPTSGLWGQKLKLQTCFKKKNTCAQKHSCL